MQGEGSFEGFSSSSNGGIDHWEIIHSHSDNNLQDHMISNSESNPSHANAVYREQHDLHRFYIDEANSSGTRNEAASHIEQQRNEASDLDSLFEQLSGVDQPVHNVNLNAEYSQFHEDTNQVRSWSSLFEANVPSSMVLQSGRPFEENSLRIGSSVERLRAICKKRALDGSMVQSSSGYFCDFQHGESSSRTPASTVCRPQNGLNISGSLDHGPRGLVSAGTVPSLSVSPIAETFNTNISVRSNPSDLQETVNAVGTVVRQPSAPSQSNLSRLVPADQHLVDLRQRHSLGAVFSRNPTTPAMSIPPIPRNMIPPFQWTEDTIAGGSSNSTAPIERNTHLDETVSGSICGNIPENPILIPAPVSQSSRNATSPNLTLASSTSRTASNTDGQTPWTHQDWTEYQRRRSELFPGSLHSSLPVEATNQRSGDHPTLPPLAPPASPNRIARLPVSDNNQMQNQAYSSAGLLFDGQGDNVVGPRNSLRALPATSRRRNRLIVSQMQNLLDSMVRDINRNLRFEEVMLLNQSVQTDRPSGVHDRYRDMRLDVDNMSYEELLALGDRIGDVCTGLNEETISKRLKQRKYKSRTKSTQDVEPCCICQEEYSEGEEMGRLECGHDFHSQCIKEWLKLKNLCPICKTTGLNTAKKQKLGT